MVFPTEPYPFVNGACPDCRLQCRVVIFHGYSSSTENETHEDWMETLRLFLDIYSCFRIDRSSGHSRQSLAKDPMALSDSRVDGMAQTLDDDRVVDATGKSTSNGHVKAQLCKVCLSL